MAAAVFFTPLQESHAVVYSCLWFCVLVGDSPATPSVGTRFLVRSRGFAFKISGPLARLLHFSTNCFMSRSAIAGFPDGATQFCTRVVKVSARCIVQGPAICELLEAVTIPSHVNSSSSCRRSWSFWACRALLPLHTRLRTACHHLQFQAPPSSWSPRRSRVPLLKCPGPAWSFG